MTGLKPYTEETKDDARAVIARRFNEHACLIAEKVLRNPFVEPGENCGDVAYIDDRPVGVQLAIKRQLFCKDRPFFGTIGGMLAMDSGDSAPALLVSMMKSTKAERWNRKLYYANTANPTSMKMNRLIGVKGQGVSSCEHVRFSVIKLGGFLRLMSRGRIPAFLANAADRVSCALARLLIRPVVIEQGIRREELDAFWAAYLKTNDGVVSSRTGSELEWAFGDEVSAGSAIMIAERDEGRIVGYVVLKESATSPGRWLVADLIAIENEARILERLLRKARRCLKRNERACLLECIGFPMKAQKVIGRVLPCSRKTSNNSFIYLTFDADVEAAIKSDKGWFFGPYDGDRCL